MKFSTVDKEPYKFMTKSRWQKWFKRRYHPVNLGVCVCVCVSRVSIRVIICFQSGGHLSKRMSYQRLTSRLLAVNEKGVIGSRQLANRTP